MARGSASGPSGAMSMAKLVTGTSVREEIGDVVVLSRSSTTGPTTRAGRPPVRAPGVDRY